MIELATAEATFAFGKRIGALVCAGDIVTLSGPLGAGKTSLARGMIAALGHSGEVPSPSYPIVIPFDPPDVRLPVLHVDLYRIDDPVALDELGLDEARADSALIVEWPERAGSGAWRDALALTLSVASDGVRALTAKVPPAWGTRWPPR